MINYKINNTKRSIKLRNILGVSYLSSHTSKPNSYNHAKFMAKKRVASRKKSKAKYLARSEAKAKYFAEQKAKDSKLKEHPIVTRLFSRIKWCYRREFFNTNYFSVLINNIISFKWTLSYKFFAHLNLISPNYNSNRKELLNRSVWLRRKVLSKKLSYLITYVANKRLNSKLEYYYFNNYLLIKSNIKKNKLSWTLAEKNLYTYNKNVELIKKHGLLYVTFSKRNTFFNLTDAYSRTLNLITVRREGFLGRRRTEYTSVFSTSRIMKQKFKAFKLDNIALVYKGWSRFRTAIKKSLRYKDQHRIPIVYVKYIVKIPHNGCRPKKKKRKKRKRTIRLKKKHHNNFFKSKLSINSKPVKKSSSKKKKPILNKKKVVNKKKV